MNFIKQPNTNQAHRSGKASSSQTNLNFHIGRLTLTGLSRIDQESVVNAMRRRLSALATQMPTLNWSHVSASLRIDGGEISSDATSEQLGNHLANHIMRHIEHARSAQDQSP